MWFVNLTKLRYSEWVFRKQSCAFYLMPKKGMRLKCYFLAWLAVSFLGVLAGDSDFATRCDTSVAILLRAATAIKHHSLVVQAQLRLFE